MPSLRHYIDLCFSLLPPSRFWRMDSGGTLYKIFQAVGDELLLMSSRIDDLLLERTPRTATETLAEWEEVYGVTPASGASDGERQDTLMGRKTAEQGVRPEDIKQTMATAMGIDASGVTVIEHDWNFALSTGQPEDIYEFFVHAPAASNTVIAAAQVLLDEISHTHTKGYVIKTTNFLCDDPDSLCDRDLLGA